MKKVLIFCLFLLIGSSSFTQIISRDSIFLTGAVMDQKTLTALPNAHIVINTNKSGIANAYGRFSFWVNIGDTINYSYIGYKKLKIVVNDSLHNNDYLFGIFLSKDTINIQEVLILPRLKNFKEEFMNAQVNTPEYVRAVNNVSSATYEALTRNANSMDAKANTDMLINNHRIRVTNKTMIPQEAIFGVSSGITKREIRRIKRKQKLKIKDNIVSDREIDILKNMYRQRINK